MCKSVISKSGPPLPLVVLAGPNLTTKTGKGEQFLVGKMVRLASLDDSAYSGTA